MKTVFDLSVIVGIPAIMVGIPAILYGILKNFKAFDDFVERFFN